MPAQAPLLDDCEEASELPCSVGHDFAPRIRFLSIGDTVVLEEPKEEGHVRNRPRHTTTGFRYLLIARNIHEEDAITLTRSLTLLQITNLHFFIALGTQPFMPLASTCPLG